MAEDLLIGFKFNDREDNHERDLKVGFDSDNLFNEMTFDATQDSQRTAGDGSAESKEFREAELSDQFDSFDYTDGFDFVM